jgi:hypothetical protein
MSRLTTGIAATAPSGASGLTVTTGAGGWTWGPWVEFIANTATPINVAELIEHSSPGSVAVQVDVQVGIGAEDDEIPHGGFFRYHIQNVGTDAAFPRVVILASAMRTIPAGSRVCLRSRQPGTTAESGTYAIKYFTALESDNIHPGEAGALPDGTTPPDVAGSATPWAWSSWVPIATLTASYDVFGIAWNVASGPSNVDLEFEVGVGDPTPVPLTRFRTAKLVNNSGRIHQILRSAACPIGAVGDVISVRVRKGGTSTANIAVSLLTYTPTGVESPNPEPGISLCGAETPYAWLELQTDESPSVKYYAKSDLAIDGTFKEGRVLTFGRVHRGFSRDRGGYETATATVELSDTDRELRSLAAAGVLLNKRCDLYLSTDAAMRSGGTPRRVMQGLVRRYKLLPGLRFRLDIEDFFGSSLSAFSGDRQIPHRVFSVDDFPNIGNPADDPTSPGNPTLMGKAIPIAYGHLSDTGVSASEGTVPCHYVGRRTVNSFEWDEYVVCGHAIKEVEEWYAAASEDAFDLPRELMPTSTEGNDFLIPGFAGWTTHVGTSNMYRDFNGHRYTVIYARGPRSDAAREGKVPFTLNIKAIEDVGDGTGTLIESLPEQIEHLLVQWILVDGGYQSGAWSDVPETGEPPYEKFRTSSTDIVQATSESRLTGGGYLGAFMLGWQGQFHPISEVVTDACRSCDIDLGLNKDGQLFMAMVDPSIAAVKDWNDVVDVLKGTFDIDHDFDRLANRIEYRYQRRYIDTPTALVDLQVGSPAAESVRLPATLREPQTDWKVDGQAQEDTTSIVDLGETRLYDLSLAFVRDPATAENVIAYWLDRLSTAPVHATFGVDLCGTDVENGDNCTLDEYQGLSVSGWTDRLIRVEEHTLDLDAMSVTLVARDIE